MADATRYGCRTCRRTDLTTTANHVLRKHTANGKRAGDENPYCTGTGPVRPETLAAEDVCPTCSRILDVHTPKGVGCDRGGRPVTASGGPNPRRAPLPGGVLTGPQTDAQSLPHDTGAVPDTLPPCEYGEGGKHVFVFGECVCGFEQPGYVAPVPVVAARVTAAPTGADVLMGGTPHNASDGYGDAMDVLMAEDAPSDGSDVLYRNGRYALPDPITGNKRTWTRATTMAETLSDLYSLNLWRIRMVLIGLARFPDLLTELQEIDGDGEEGKLDPKIHKDVLNRIGGKAQSLAGAKVPASWGTEMHTCIERLSRDEITLDEVPEKYADEVTAWAAAMQEADLSAVPHLIERRVVIPMYGTAGTFDQVCRVHRGRSIRLGNRIIRLNAGDHIIGDVKSGRDLDYAWGEISIQTSLYAHGARDVGKVAVWNPEADEDGGAWEWEDIGIPAKSIRTDVAVIMHVPIGSGECTLYWIDLEEGWKAVQLCEAVRDWRKAKGLHMPFSIAEVATSKPVVREPSWQERFEAVTTKDQGRTVYREWLAAGGSPDGPDAARFRKIMKDRISQLTESTA